MAPIRRYLRITQYSVLECRIYLDNPALAPSWLLNPRDPVLPRVLDAVRPLVLPKLREERERERTRKKGAKKRNIKDVVTQDGFEVSIFLTETDTRHSVLFKHKYFRDKKQTKLTSNSTRLTGASADEPVDLDASPPLDPPLDPPAPPVSIREESDDEDPALALRDIPAAEPDAARTTRRSRRRRREHTAEASEADASADGPSSRGEDRPSSEGSAGGDSDDSLWVEQRPSKRPREGEGEDEDEDEDSPPAPQQDRDEGRAKKKKLAMDISYEGFAIYGRVLCLVVRRLDDGLAGSRGGARTARAASSAAGSGGRAQAAAAGGGGPAGGQAVMENWITSTQMPPPAVDDGEEADG